MNIRHTSSALFLALLMTACGGGGGSVSSDTAPTPKAAQMDSGSSSQDSAGEAAASSESSASSTADISVSATSGSSSSVPSPAPGLSAFAEPVLIEAKVPPAPAPMAQPEVQKMAVPQPMAAKTPVLLEVKVDTALVKLTEAASAQSAKDEILKFQALRGSSAADPRDVYRQACAAIVHTATASLLSQGQDPDQHPETQSNFDKCMERSRSLPDSAIQAANQRFFMSAL